MRPTPQLPSNPIERLTIAMPADMAALVKDAVASGDYASVSEVVRAALRDWKAARAVQQQEFADLKADVERGLADLAAGRLTEFDKTALIARGRALLAKP
ncbi:MAG: ribbon-helix-helix protein, CopG family [Pseudomonadota bacterium]